MADVISALLSALAVVLVAMLNNKTSADKKEREKRQKDADESEAARAECYRLLLKMIYASVAQGEATIIAVTQGKTNGELKEARMAVKAAKDEYRAFSEAQSYKHINERN